MKEKAGMAEVLTTADVAQILRLSIKTVGDLMRSGELPAMRIGGVWRVRRESLEMWMKQRETSNTQRSNETPAVVKL
jgi:excisionase family DNA binding protein